MQNIIAINAAAQQGIIAAQATSDEMLLESIADGGRTAMHTSIPAIMSGFTASSFASSTTPQPRKTSSARPSSTSGAPRASSKAALRFRPGCCRSRASRR